MLTAVVYMQLGELHCTMDDNKVAEQCLTEARARLRAISNLQNEQDELKARLGDEEGSTLIRIITHQANVAFNMMDHQRMADVRVRLVAILLLSFSAADMT